MCSQQTQEKFDLACCAFRLAPNLPRLLAVNQAALPMLENPPAKPYLPPLPHQDWITVDSPDAFARDFYEIRVVIDRYLTHEEARRAAGCLGYALKQELAGEELSEPCVIQSCRAGQTILLLCYDSTKSRRDDPDFDRTFALAESYIAEGSPIRMTNRAGCGTRGTRLVAGIGPCCVQFAVR